jgi:hypothetical protein
MLISPNAGNPLICYTFSRRTHLHAPRYTARLARMPHSTTISCALLLRREHLDQERLEVVKLLRARRVRDALVRVETQTGLARGRVRDACRVQPVARRSPNLHERVVRTVAPEDRQRLVMGAQHLRRE